MALSAFDNKSQRPKPGEVNAVLGKTAKLWQQLIGCLSENYAPITEEWNFAGARFGWSLRLKHRDRIIFYLIPQAGRFLVGVVLGEKAARAAHERRLSVSVLKLIDAAPRYAEGRGIRFTVTTKKDLAAALELAGLKMGWESFSGKLNSERRSGVYAREPIGSQGGSRIGSVSSTGRTSGGRNFLSTAISYMNSSNHESDITR